MTNTLSTTRDALATLLSNAGLQVVSYLPERPTPPLVIVGAGHPYVKRDNQFGQHVIQMNVLMLTQTATNETATEALDEMIATVAIEVFNSSEFNLGTVDQPAQFTVGTAKYLGCTADVTHADVIEVTP